MLKIVISPAKKMNITDEFPCNATVPVFSDRADVLHGILKNKNISYKDYDYTKYPLKRKKYDLFLFEKFKKIPF